MMVNVWAAYGDALLVDAASRGLLTAFLAAFGRAIAEVGAIIIVGGNIRGYTRTMTTASFALALGVILIILSMTVSGLSLAFGRALTGR